MNVLLINGSPHKEGCTYRALEEVALVLNHEDIATDFFWIGNKPVSDCLACRACMQNGGVCAINDKVNEFLDIAAVYDGFIFGTAVHWAGATGALTSFMDRATFADNCGNQNRFRLKPAAVVACARRAGTTATWDQVNKYFGAMEMPIISSNYWNMVHGINVSDVEHDLEGLLTMRTLGKNMAWFLKCKEAGEKAGIHAPQKEKPVFNKQRDN